MWSDMFFNLASKDGSYYSVPEDYEWPKRRINPAIT